MYLETSSRPVQAANDSAELQTCDTVVETANDVYLASVLDGWYPPFKSALDFALATILLILTTPVMILAAIAIKVSSRGPVIYYQRRVGKDGRPFTILKLRTMRHNCESVSGPQWSTKNDSRVTAVGRFLRATHIDEFPQLWNVLKGDMSLVGPRPERPEFVEDLQRMIPRYEDRLLVRPGITGLAQVNLPPDTDIASVQCKLMYDLFYVRRMGLWLDLRLLFCTFFASLGVSVRVIHSIHRVMFMPTHQMIRQDFDDALVDQPAVPQLEPA